MCDFFGLECFLPTRVTLCISQSACVLSSTVVSGSATPWTVACQPPLAINFSDKNTGMDCYFLLLRIFLTQGWNSRLLHWQLDPSPLSHLGSPFTKTFVQRSSYYRMVCPPCEILDTRFPIIFPLHPSPALLGSQSSAHGILQARILEWEAIPFSGGIFPTQESNPHLLHWQADSLLSEPLEQPFQR